MTRNLVKPWTIKPRFPILLITFGVGWLLTSLGLVPWSIHEKANQKVNEKILK